MWTVSSSVSQWSGGGTVPQRVIVFVQAQGRGGRRLHFAGRQKVVKMRMGMQDLRHGQPEILHLTKNPFGSATRIHDNGQFGHGVAKDRAIAAERRYGKRLPNEFCHRKRLCKYANAQAVRLQLRRRRPVTNDEPGGAQGKTVRY